MKLSFNTWTYCSFPIWLPAYPIEYVIKNLAKIGYDGIEIGCASPVAYPPYMTKEDRKRISGLLKENKIAVSSVLPAPGTGCGNNVASPIKAERLQAIQSYKDCIDLAYDLGGAGKVCLYVAGWVIWGVDQDQAWEWSKECLVEIAAYAKQKDMIMAVEPTPEVSNLIETADDALKLMREVKMDNVKVMFDTIHAYYRGEVPADLVDKMGSDLVHIHISDKDRTPPGTYNDFRGLIDALKSINFKGYLTMEIGFVGRKDPNGFARKSYEYMKKIL
jgi:protein FrlC